MEMPVVMGARGHGMKDRGRDDGGRVRTVSAGVLGSGLLHHSRGTSCGDPSCGDPSSWDPESRGPRVAGTPSPLSSGSARRVTSETGTAAVLAAVTRHEHYHNSVALAVT
ncbi:unnamed protein product [Lampetra fluviatilis]